MSETSYRNPADIVRQRTDDQRSLHEERRQQAAELEERSLEEFQKRSAQDEEPDAGE